MKALKVAMKFRRVDALFLVLLFVLYLFLHSLIYKGKPTVKNKEYLFSNSSAFILLSEDLRTFVEISNVYDVKLFVIEPSFVFNVLTEKQKQIARKFTTPDLYFGIEKHVNYLTFGIFDSDFTSMLNSPFWNALGKHGFTYSFDFNRKYKPHFAHLLHPVSVIHCFISDIAHITVFYNSSNSWFWIGETSMKSEARRTVFGKYDQLFDSFRIERNSLSIVNDTRFLVNLQSSKFVECNYSLAAKVNKSIGAEKHVAKRRSTKEALRLIQHLSDNLTVPFFLMGGTLLGWYRNCDVINYDTDNDFATFANFASYELTKNIRQLLQPTNFDLIETFGLPDTAYELRIINSNPRQIRNQIDLFFLYPESDTYFCGYHYDLRVSFIKLVYKRKLIFPICSAIHLSMKVLVPCNSHLYLQREYGKNWFVSDPMGHYHSRESIVYWTDNEKPFTYQCLGFKNKRLLKEFKTSVKVNRTKLTYRNMSNTDAPSPDDYNTCWKIRVTRRDEDV